MIFIGFLAFISNCTVSYAHQDIRRKDSDIINVVRQKHNTDIFKIMNPKSQMGRRVTKK